jgi:hypothetical protein
MNFLKFIIVLIFLIGIVSNSDLMRDECSLEVNPKALYDPDCARKKWGQNYYYVTQKIYDEEVLPYELRAERFSPGTYTLKTSNNENIVFNVTYSKPFYCGKVKRYLYNRVQRQKPILTLRG